ncbi:MAG: cobalamin B12-binding domain-containing protein [Alsobacter sp.]
MLVLNPNLELSSEFIRDLEDRGLSLDRLFVDLLEPAARCLGTMWDEDECSFIDVTIGVARLQQLLAVFSRSWVVPAFRQKRRVCMLSIAEEQHSFGVTMVETFLRAGGWEVTSERGMTLQQVAPLLRSQWFAVVGLTASTDRQIGSLTATIRQIRQHSRNPVVGIMVGGPPFSDCPRLAAQVGADATAINAPAAVLLAQRLFDIGAGTNWQDSFPAG